MKEGFETFATHFDFTFLSDKNPFLFLLFGIILAASIQSSSASMMIFMSSLAAGVITFDKALYLVIGADLGTTITAIIGTINANSIKKKVVWSLFFFIVFTAILALILMRGYLYCINEIMNIKDPLIALASFHSMLNLVGILVMFPLIKYFTKFIDKYIAGKEASLAKKIMLVNPAESHTALEALQNESREFFVKALRVLHNFFHLNYEKDDKNEIHSYSDLKNYENEIVNFYIKVQQTSLTADEVSKINSLAAAIRNATLSAKDIKDIEHNMDELHNASDDDLHAFNKTVRENQKHFYNEVLKLTSNNFNYTPQDLLRLKELHKSKYQTESENIYKLYTEKKHRDIVIPNLLNMIREIDESNHALLRSMSNMLLFDEK